MFAGMMLEPEEVILLQEQAQMREGKDLKNGILQVTNIRIIWRRDTVTLLNEYRINFESAQV